MHCPRRWTPTCIEEERFALFKVIQDEIEVSMSKEDSPPQEMMNRDSIRETTAKTCQKGHINIGTTKTFWKRRSPS